MDDEIRQLGRDQRPVNGPTSADRTLRQPIAAAIADAYARAQAARFDQIARTWRRQMWAQDEPARQQQQAIGRALSGKPPAEVEEPEKE